MKNKNLLSQKLIFLKTNETFNLAWKNQQGFVMVIYKCVWVKVHSKLGFQKKEKGC
jgi:hypothetical protein